MKVLFLGTGSGSSRNTYRFKAGIYVESEGKLFLDMGPGSNLRIDDYHVDADTVFFTHLHIDHIDGVFDYMVSRKVRGLNDLTIFSPPGFSKILNSYMETGNQISANVKESKLPKGKVDDLEVYSVKACHSIYAVSYVITDGKRKLIYTGDTAEPCEELLSEIREADVVIHEASCVEDCKKFGHTSVKELISMFGDQSKKRIILTHIPTHIEDEIYNAVGKKFTIARDGTTFEI
jgi:ribonuclease BN (tRNA processing enzyme)